MMGFFKFGISGADFQVNHVKLQGVFSKHGQQKRQRIMLISLSWLCPQKASRNHNFHQSSMPIWNCVSHCQFGGWVRNLVAIVEVLSLSSIFDFSPKMPRYLTLIRGHHHHHHHHHSPTNLVGVFKPIWKVSVINLDNFCLKKNHHPWCKTAIEPWDSTTTCGVMIWDDQSFLANEPRKKTSYFPWNPGCLIGILKMVYEIIPL